MKRRLVAAAAVLLALLVWWWRRGDVPARAPAPRATAAAVIAPAAGETSEVPADELPPAAPDRPTTAAGAPIIDEILVEKTELCEGEESLVTVRAHTPGHADDAHLHYLIGTQTGSRVAVVGRHRESDDGEAPPRTVMVFGRDNVATEAAVPEIRVKDCQVPRRVHIHSRLLPNTTDEIELYAQVIDLGAATRMKPVKARWHFGDGTRGDSSAPLTSHDYGGRPQITWFSQFLVEVEVEGADGEVVRGRTSLQLLNPSFEHRHYRGVVLLRTALAPRFPTVDASGKVVQQVRVWHDHDAAVTLTRITRRYHALDGSAGEPERLAPGVLLPTASIDRQGVTATAELDTRARPDVFSIEYVLEGQSADGLPAQGGFSVMRPPDRPTADQSQPVLDDALRARIVRAREHLKQDYVTDEDLGRLEREGAFADLPPLGQLPAPVAGDKGAATVPPPRPGH